MYRHSEIHQVHDLNAVHEHSHPVLMDLPVLLFSCHMVTVIPEGLKKKSCTSKVSTSFPFSCEGNIISVFSPINCYCISSSFYIFLCIDIIDIENLKELI